jgi:hypothetical protein
MIRELLNNVASIKFCMVLSESDNSCYLLFENDRLQCCYVVSLQSHINGLFLVYQITRTNQESLHFVVLKFLSVINDCM